MDSLKELKPYRWPFVCLIIIWIFAILMVARMDSSRCSPKESLFWTLSLGFWFVVLAISYYFGLIRKNERRDD